MNNDNNINQEYSGQNIKVLKGLEPVKVRPGMYIGNTDDGSGYHNMAFEVIDNSIDESLAGYCKNIVITLHKDGFLSVKDDGRGIPTDYNETEKKSSAEVIMTVLHAGGKFDKNSYKISGGLHGVGVSVVNALSERLELDIWRNGFHYKQVYVNSVPVSDLQKLEETDINGTMIKFKPSEKYFKEVVKFSKNVLYERIRQISFLNKGINIDFVDEATEEKINFYNEAGLNSYVEYLISKGKKNVLNQQKFYVNKQFKSILVEMSMQWTDMDNEIIKCFTNNIPQGDGGSHLTAFKNSITQVIKDYLKSEYEKKKSTKDLEIKGDDVRNGIVCVISLKMEEPRFASQTKDKLVSSEVKEPINSCLKNDFSNFLYENPSEASLICDNIINSAQSREAARKAKEAIRKGALDKISLGLPGKLWDCQDKNPENTELFIVEGDSAGGTAKMGRNRKNQAILPIKGKILNVEKSELHKIINSKEIKYLIQAIGCNPEAMDLNDLRYHKIIIMTDADVDGSHIRTLLLTFLYRKMFKLLQGGHVYIAQPPLYKVSRGKSYIYLKDEDAFNKYIYDIIIDKVFISNKDKENIILQGKGIINFIDLINKLQVYLEGYFDYNLAQSLIYIENFVNEDVFNSEESLKSYMQELSTYYNEKIIGNFNTIDYSIENLEYKGLVSRINISYQGYEREFVLSRDFLNTNMFNVIKNIREIVNNFSKTEKNYIYFNETKLELVDNLLLIKEWLFNESSKGINIQRYKGLGEMNGEQLWETTMDEEKRSLQKVTIEDLERSEEILSILMGENIPERRKYIEDNALNANIDI